MSVYVVPVGSRFLMHGFMFSSTCVYCTCKVCMAHLTKSESLKGNVSCKVPVRRPACTNFAAGELHFGLLQSLSKKSNFRHLDIGQNRTFVDITLKSVRECSYNIGGGWVEIRQNPEFFCRPSLL